MNEIMKRSLLFDFYGELLTEHQRDIYEQHVLNDLSLGEIAESSGISRQGVHDLVRRCDKALGGYEEKLGLVRRFLLIREQVDRIGMLSDALRQPDADVPALAGRIRELSGQILKEL